MTTRRAFITGLVSFMAAPAIVRAGSLMPVKVMEPIAEYGISPFFTAGGWGELIEWNRVTLELIRAYRVPEEYLRR